MSYNVDTWKTKELVDLRIPVSSLFKHERTDWHPKRTNNDDGTVVFTVMEGSEICGTIEDGILVVDSINAQGEGSGTALNWIFEPALKDSTGKLVVSRVWARGDSIDRLTVENGALESTPIDI